MSIKLQKELKVPSLYYIDFIFKNHFYFKPKPHRHSISELTVILCALLQVLLTSITV